MNELTVNDILEEMCFEEVNEYMKIHAPRHHFSRRHRKAMNEILCPRAEYKLNEPISGQRHIPVKKRIWIVVLVIILAAIGITAGAEAIRGFNRRVHQDNTELLTANAENCPKTIENVYYLSEIPEGYELYKIDSSGSSVYTSYVNPNTNSWLVVTQYIKDGYKSNFNTEYNDFEELEINGNYALYLDSSDSEEFFGSIVWDNGDYILEISGYLPKKELFFLAKSAKK